jgi:hypothetical protein
MTKVFSSMTGARAGYDPVADRIASVQAREMERLECVRAQAIPMLRRLAGMTPDASGKVDVFKLNAALAGKDIQARMTLKTMLAELGMIPVI